ncbi:homoserine O-acetyltransferase MetX [Alkalinema pantanalense CENA528]|uniref:homoserine O-acetyltransferase MetX n=1 Tax=Alkalinema pantanalense TaxID=1620705 RepID=UPI003D6E9E9E
MHYQQWISSKTQFYQLPEPLGLESGGNLPNVQVAYRTWGTLNSQGDNAILICHALTGSADADRWWKDLFGSGKVFDPGQDFIICSNILGSCYGTTGPTSLNPIMNEPYASTFPTITIRDMVRVQAKLLEQLSVQRLKLVIGGSLGGMQVLEWALLYPDWVQAIVPIATSGRHSAWCVALSEAQRQAIYADPHWAAGRYSPEQSPNHGLAIARMIAMSTYRSWQSFEQRFGRQIDRASFPYSAIPKPPEGVSFSVQQYLYRHGQKLVERFDANTYITLTQAMDYHDISHQRGEYGSVLQTIHQPTLVVSIDTDVLYPPSEQQFLAEAMPKAQWTSITSIHGHDGFLIDTQVLNDRVVAFGHSLGWGNALTSSFLE